MGKGLRVPDQSSARSRVRVGDAWGPSLDNTVVKNGSNGVKARNRVKAEERGLTYQQALNHNDSHASDGTNPKPALQRAKTLGFLGSGYNTRLIVKNIGFVWATRGDRILVLRYSSKFPSGWPRDRGMDAADLRDLTLQPTPVRAVEGSGVLDEVTIDIASEGCEVPEQAVALALEVLSPLYDRVLLVACGERSLPDLADVYVYIEVEKRVPTGERRGVIENGHRIVRTFPYDAAQAAIELRRRLLWMFREEYRADWPLAGLLLIEPANRRRMEGDDTPHASPQFVAAVDEQMAAGGTPILGRLPREPYRPGQPDLLAVAEQPDSLLSAAYQAAAEALRDNLPFVPGGVVSRCVSERRSRLQEGDVAPSS